MEENREKAKAIICLDEEEQQPGEEWCFECKDGGQLVICDHQNCGKVYHPNCVEKDDSFFDTVKSWFCDRHFCNDCNEPPKFYCLGCPNAVCKQCVAASEFTVVRGVKGLCIDCLELVEIIEQNLDQDSEGNKITLNDRETYECLFKEYWEIIKVKEGLTSDGISAAQRNYKKDKIFVHHENFSKRVEEKQNDSMSWESDEGYKPAKRKRCNSKRVEEKQNDSMSWDSDEGYKPAKRKRCNSKRVEEKQNDSMSWDSDEGYKPAKRKRYNSKRVEEKQNDSVSWDSDEGYKPAKWKRYNGKRVEEKQNDSMLWDSDEGYRPAKRKRYNSKKFMGWGSKPLINFLASIGKYETEPLTKWAVNSLIHEYIKEKNLHHPKYKGKFLLDEWLFPIFRKKVMSKRQIYPLLEFHLAKKLDDSSGEKNDDQIKNSSTDKHLNDQTTSMQSRLSSLIGKSPFKKGDFFIKHSLFASINTNNINLIYLKRSLVLELSKQPESFMGKVVGTFVRAKVDFNDSRQRMSHQLVRVLGVVFDKMSNGAFLQVSFMPKAIPIYELSDVEFTEQECEDLRQKVKSSLLPKLTVVEVEEKAKSLHEDITKHRILTRLVYLQNQIDRANLRGRSGLKIALLEEKEKLEQSWKQEQSLPSVRPEFIEAKYDDSEDDCC